MRRIIAQAGLLFATTLALAVWAGATSPASRVIFQDSDSPSQGAPTPSAARTGPHRLLVQLFLGRTIASAQEVSITTIFRPRSFVVLADADVTGGSEQALISQVREVFSLGEVVSLGSSIVPLSGGAAMLDDDGDRIELRLQGHALGERAVRLVVSELRDGQEVVATSVIARSGKTVVLAGPAAARARGDQEINFVCLTPLD
jgi:hypothetical protein